MTIDTQVVNDDLRRWIVVQLEAGCRRDDVIAAMRSAGWTDDVANAALAQMLASPSLPSLPSLPSTSPPPPPPAAPAVPATPAIATALPEPDLSGAPSIVTVGDRAVRVLATLQQPRVVVFGGLLSDAECVQLMALAEPRLARSETVDNATGGSEVNASRTSDGMFFERGQTELIAQIEQRIATLLRWPVDHGEGLQILRYRPGAEYRPHHDYFDPQHPGSTPILRRGGQRVGTLVVYLNTPAGGGATTFPDVGFDVAPIRGNAVFFSYDRAHADTRTLHGGAPVTAGEKWVATKWLRQGVFT